MRAAALRRESPNDAPIAYVEHGDRLLARVHGVAENREALVGLVGGSLGLATGVLAAWRRGSIVDRGSVWGGLLFYSLPTQWLALMLILYLAGPLHLPTSDIADPYQIITWTTPEGGGGPSYKRL